MTSSNDVFTIEKLRAAYDALPKLPHIRIVRGFPMCYADRITLNGVTTYLLSDSAWRDTEKHFTGPTDPTSSTLLVGAVLAGVPVEDFKDCRDRTDLLDAWFAAHLARQAFVATRADRPGEKI